MQNGRVAARIPSSAVRRAALAEPDLERYTIPLPAGILRRAHTRSHCVKQASCVVMRRVRSVSGHVSLARYLPPPPLRSTRITGLHRYYERLRIPGPLRPLPRFSSLSETARLRTPEPGSPWLPHTRYTSSTGSAIPGGLGVLAKTHTALLPAGCLETIGPFQHGHFGT